MRVIGTAGHVDHGKTTLIKALTGIDPDRLREEQERGMTIDLGFAWLRLPNGEEVSIVDVPGHERFVHNMLAGVGGIDIGLLVIAADEGIMPQTREHLAILDLLAINTGVVALTKVDLVDSEWVDLVKAEVEESLADTSLAGSPMVEVSGTTGQGLEKLVEALQQRLSAERPRPNHGRPRLPIDRVFTMPGFGTVVTGTLIEGELEVGQELEVQPGGRKVRVRGLQSHRKKAPRVPAGTRAAVNLSSVERDELSRGQVLASPGWLTPTRALDVRLRVIKDATRPVPHNLEVSVHTGTAEAMGKVLLLEAGEIKPGGSGWAQIRLAKPMAVAKGDPLIIRIPSPAETVGGGTIVDPHPKRHRRFQPRVVSALEVLERGSPEEMVLAELAGTGAVEFGALVRRTGLPAGQGREIVGRLAQEGRVVALDGRDAAAGPSTLVISSAGWEHWLVRIREALVAYHRSYPLRRGMPREEARAMTGAEARLFAALASRLKREGAVVEEGPLLRLPDHVPGLSREEEQRAELLVQTLRRSGFSPEPRQELEARLGVSPEVTRALIERGDLEEVSPDLIYDRETYDKMERQVIESIKARGSITVAQTRDLFENSRKYALALMAHLDERHRTRRVGDERVLGPHPDPSPKFGRAAREGGQ